MNNATLVRETFQTSRQLEYFTEKELTVQCGHGPARWGEVILDQLIANALDACESADILPEVAVTLTSQTIDVVDNGPGFDPAVVQGVLDFSKRVSSKDKYVSPTRGAQGNALKTIVPMPFVLAADGQPDPILIESQGHRHTITIGLDRIAQVPRIELTSVPSEQIGTSILVPFSKQNFERSAASDCSLNPMRAVQSLGDVEFDDDEDRPEDRPIHVRLDALFTGYALFNPHATFIITDRKKTHRIERTVDHISKWKPNDPTCAHWYTADQFRDLIAAYVAHEAKGGPVLSLRDFLALFHGLRRTHARQAVLGGMRLAGPRLRDLVKDGDLDARLLTRLLTRMQAATRPVKPLALGLLGDAHLTTWLTQHGHESIRYAKTLGVDADQRPFVVETAFGERLARGGERRVLTGLNFAPTLVDPFRHLDDSGLSLSGLLGQLLFSRHDPATLVVHVTAPSLAYTDRGKSSLAEMPDIGAAIEQNVTKVLKAWTAYQKRLIRTANRAAWRPSREKRDSLKAICWRLMARGYAQAAGSVQMAFARQVFYAVRLLAQLSDDDKTLNSVYFTQTLLPDYLAAHPDQTSGWDVLFDDRGHFTEPHTGRSFGIGTLSSRDFLAACDQPPSLALGQLSTAFPTLGPANRFANVLLVEKEGFGQILAAAGIERRYDLAIMSSKGMNSTSIRTLVEHLPGVRVFTLHDCDKSGFSILGTLTRSTRRYHFTRKAHVIDLGIRLDDIEREHLASEPVKYTKNPEANLALNGATQKEIAWLLADGGRRVELNAFTNDHLIAWLERKLQTHGVTKLIPTDDVLAVAYRRATRIHAVNRLIAESEQQTGDRTPIPSQLRDRVQQMLKETPTMPWDAAVAEIARTADD